MYRFEEKQTNKQTNKQNKTKTFKQTNKTKKTKHQQQLSFILVLFSRNYRHWAANLQLIYEVWGSHKRRGGTLLYRFKLNLQKVKERLTFTEKMKCNVVDVVMMRFSFSRFIMSIHT